MRSIPPPPLLPQSAKWSMEESIRNCVWIEVEFSLQKKKEASQTVLSPTLLLRYSFRVTTWLLITYPVGNEPDPRVLVQLWNIHSPKINRRPTMIFLSFSFPSLFSPSYLLLLTHFPLNERRETKRDEEKRRETKRKRTGLKSWGFASSVKTNKKKRKRKEKRNVIKSWKRDEGGDGKKKSIKVKHEGGMLLVFPRVRASFYYLGRTAGCSFN